MPDYSRLVADINEFLAETGMGPSYFGRKSVGNSELVSRLRAGGRVWPETEMSIRVFMETHRHKRKRGHAAKAIQEARG